MKVHRMVMLVVASWLITADAFSQASFTFRNGDSRGVNAPVFDSLGVPLSGFGYLAELWGGPTPDSLAPVVLFNSDGTRIIKPFTSATAGYVHPTDPGTPVVSTVEAGGFAYLQMLAWDASLGGAYEEVVAKGLGGYGESPIFYAQGGYPLGPGPTPPAPLIGLESFSLRAVIPEPSTYALFVLGSLLVLASGRVRAVGEVRVADKH
jgi:hypothetical protein